MHLKLSQESSVYMDTHGPMQLLYRFHTLEQVSGRPQNPDVFWCSGHHSHLGGLLLMLQECGYHKATSNGSLANVPTMCYVILICIAP